MILELPLFFAVNTLATGIYEVWFEMNSPAGAAQIALVMFTFVGVFNVLRKQKPIKKTLLRAFYTFKKDANDYPTSWFQSMACVFLLLHDYYIGISHSI